MRLYFDIKNYKSSAFLHVLALALIAICINIVFTQQIFAAQDTGYQVVKDREFWSSEAAYPPGTITDSAGITYQQSLAPGNNYEYKNNSAVTYSLNGGVACMGGFFGVGVGALSSNDTPQSTKYYDVNGNETSDQNQYDLIVKQYALRYQFQNLQTNTGGDNTVQCDPSLGATTQQTVTFYLFYGNDNNPRQLAIINQAKAKMDKGSVVIGTYTIPEGEDKTDGTKIMNIVDIKNNITFTRTDGSQPFIAANKSSDGKCNVEISGLTLVSEDRGGVWSASIREFTGTCSTASKSVPIPIQRSQDVNPDNEREDEKDGVSCGDVGGVLGFVICPLGDLGDKVTDFIDNAMYSLLEIPVESWETSGAKDAWESFRTISSVLIVLVALVGIASQIFNFDFVSAYTVRKVLPKLFIAVILIQLSWFLGTVMIEISNVIGYSIQSIILTPFVNVAADRLGDSVNLSTLNFKAILGLYTANSTNETIASGTVVGIMGIAALMVGGGAIAGGMASMFMIGGMLISAGIAMLVAFTVIVLRYVLILGLLIVMPLALVAWILPNTKKWFDQWWNMWFALLAMFPIVIAVLSLGKAAAIILALSAGGS